MKRNPIEKEKNPVISQDLSEIISATINWEQLRGKSILVTGAGGFLAAYLIKSILTASIKLNLSIKVIGIARSIESIKVRLSDWIDDEGFTFYQQDMSLPLNADFPRADYYVHAASQASPKFYGIDPIGTLLPNSVGTARLLDRAHSNGAERFLFFSSGSVYGQQSVHKSSIAESDFGILDPTNSRACYAESKRMGETMCVAWAHQYKLHTNIVRPFHTYGPGVSLNDGRVFADFVSDVVAGRNIVIKSDGLARRAFCYLSDATVGFLTVMLEGESGQAYNVGNPDAEISIKELANIIAELNYNRKVSVSFGQQPEGSQYLRSLLIQSCPSIDKISAFGWQPSIGVSEGFKRTINSFLLR